VLPTASTPGTSRGRKLRATTDGLFRSGSPGGTRSTQAAKPHLAAHEGADRLKIAIAGGHGQIALRLSALLAVRGDDVVGLIRNPDHTNDVRAAGASPAVCDLELASVEEVAEAIDGSDAVVFAAGAGPGSGAERKVTMDRDGAIKLLRAATASGVGRYVMVSGSGVENPPSGDEVFEVYLRSQGGSRRGGRSKRSGLDDPASGWVDRRHRDRERAHRDDAIQRTCSA
jgi:hypothetical protein